MTNITISSDLAGLPWQHWVLNEHFKHIFLYTSMLFLNHEESIDIIRIWKFAQNMRPNMALINPSPFVVLQSLMLYTVARQLSNVKVVLEKIFFRFLAFYSMTAILVKWPWPFDYHYFFSSHFGFIWNTFSLSFVVLKESGLQSFTIIFQLEWPWSRVLNVLDLWHSDAIDLTSFKYLRVQ